MRVCIHRIAVDLVHIRRNKLVKMVPMGMCVRARVRRKYLFVIKR